MGNVTFNSKPMAFIKAVRVVSLGLPLLDNVL